MKPAHYLLAASLLLSTSAASAQDDGKGKDKDKYKKEYKDKEYKDKDRKDYDKDRKDYDKDRRKDYEKDRKDYDKDRDERYKEGRAGRYDSRYPRPTGGLGGVLGGPGDSAPSRHYGSARTGRCAAGAIPAPRRVPRVVPQPSGGPTAAAH